MTLKDKSKKREFDLRRKLKSITYQLVIAKKIICKMRILLGGQNVKQDQRLSHKA